MNSGALARGACPIAPDLRRAPDALDQGRTQDLELDGHRARAERELARERRRVRLAEALQEAGHSRFDRVGITLGEDPSGSRVSPTLVTA
jgi:hypothetical protein